MRWISKSISKYALKVFDKEAGLGVSLNEKLVGELHKAIIKKFKRRKLMGDLKAVSRQQM